MYHAYRDDDDDDDNNNILLLLQCGKQQICVSHVD